MITLQHKLGSFFCILFGMQLGLSQIKTPPTYQEPYRLQYHFSPPANWMNDPNGLVYFKGSYHLFYQYYPDGMVWGPMHWGHAVSPDLLHWEHLPIALYPDSLGWIFSGSAVVDSENTAGFGKDAIVAIFTYHNDAIWKAGKKNTESQGIAYSIDEGKTWTKYADNPVLNNSGEQDFRDPKVFWNTTLMQWNMVLAAGNRIKIYRSADLKHWQFESDFKPETDLPNLGVWECPDLFPMTLQTGEVKWVMLVNHGDKGPNGGSGTRYFVGDFDGKTFRADQASHWLDYGTDFYAAVTYSNVPDGRRILLGWMSNWQYATQVPTSPWRSSMTLPRNLNLVEEKGEYVIRQQMIPELATLTSPVHTWEAVRTPFETTALLSQASIRLELDELDSDLQVELSNKNGEVYTLLLSKEQLSSNRQHSGEVDFNAAFAAKPQIMPLGGLKVKVIEMQLDQTSIEVLLNDGALSMTNLYFPKTPYTQLRILNATHQSIKKISLNTVKSVWDSNLKKS